jgi:hypothetical protein
MTIVERIDHILGQTSNEYYNKPLKKYERALETYYLVKDMQGAFLVKTPSGKRGFKIKSDMEHCI